LKQERSEIEKKIEHSWQDLLYKLKRSFKKKPDLQTMLFLIGMQEFGAVREFTKEEKQDLMHIAICRLLCFKGFYELDFYDDDGWPHYKLLKEHPKMNLVEQEYFLKSLVLKYFEDLDEASN